MSEKAGALRIISTPAVHTLNRDVWIAEPGLREGDEFNLIKSGRNYKWDIITHGIEYSGEKSGERLTQK